MEQLLEEQQQVQGYTIPLTAEQITERLKKIPSLALFCHGKVDKNYIVLDIEPEITTGLVVKFRAPVSCTSVTRLAIRQIDADGKVLARKIFAFADANGNDIGDVNNLFRENAIVSAILDTAAQFEGTDGAAFVQNADTNSYIETTFAKKAEIGTTFADIETQLTDLNTKLDSKALIKLVTWEDSD